MNARIAGIVVAAFAVLLYFSTYTVAEWQRAILFQLGEIKAIDLDPGLHFKLPFVNNVRKFDGRVLTLDAAPDRFLTNEKKNVTVDFAVRWRIDDVGLYYRSFRGEELNARDRLGQIMRDEMRNEFSKRTIQEAVSGERGDIMDAARVKTKNIVEQFGMDISDVRISRIDLPEEVNEAVYERMRTERFGAAKEFRARGQEQAARIRAAADREVTVILANAYRKAQTMRGEGDARAAQIYANAYNENPEFYTFYRSLGAYRNSFSGKNDILIVEPEGEFFRYFNHSGGGGKYAAPQPPRAAADPAPRETPR
jgi:membrane protease subunit HflC